MVGTAFTGIAAGTAFTGTWAALAATAFTGTWATLTVGAGAAAACLARAALAAITWASPPCGCAAAALATAASQPKQRGTILCTMESW